MGNYTIHVCWISHWYSYPTHAHGIIVKYTYGPQTWLVRGNTPKVNVLHVLTYLLMLQDMRQPLGKLQESS